MTFNKILNNFKKKKILVIGDLILDRYIWGKVSRISPEAPVPVVEVTEENFLLGGASNVAHNIVSLGASATIVGMAGNDRSGELMLEILGEKGIKSSGVLRGSRPTTVKTRVIAHNQQVVRFDRENKDKIDNRILKNLLQYIQQEIPGHDGVIVSDYKKGIITPELMKEIIKCSRHHNTFVAVDPKVGHFHFYRYVSLVTPNVMEATHASGIEIKDEKTLIRAGKMLLKKLSCEAVLVTKGEHGMSLFDKERVTHIPTLAKHVYDVTGAGDTVIATFTLAHVSGASMRNAAVIANHAAGIVVGEVGTAVAAQEQLRESLSLNRGKLIQT